MLHRRHHDRATRRFAQPVKRQVVRLSSAGGEDDPARFKSTKFAELVAGIIDGSPRSPSRSMRTRWIPHFGRPVVQRLKRFWPHGTRRGVIEIELSLDHREETMGEVGRKVGGAWGGIDHDPVGGSTSVPERIWQAETTQIKKSSGVINGGATGATR